MTTSRTTEGRPTSPAQWKRLAAAYVKYQLLYHEITYEHMTKELSHYGVVETEASIAMKLQRGGFSAAWLFACCAVLNLVEIPMKEVYASETLLAERKTRKRMSREERRLHLTNALDEWDEQSPE